MRLIQWGAKIQKRKKCVSELKTVKTGSTPSFRITGQKNLCFRSRRKAKRASVPSPAVEKPTEIWYNALFGTGIFVRSNPDETGSGDKK